MVSTLATVPSWVVQVTVAGNEEAFGTFFVLKLYDRYAASNLQEFATFRISCLTLWVVVQSDASVHTPPGLVGTTTFFRVLPAAVSSTVTLYDTDTGSEPAGRSGIAQVSVPSPLSVSPAGSGVTRVTSVGRVSFAFAPVTSTDDVLVAVSVYVMVEPVSTLDPGAGTEDFFSVHPPTGWWVVQSASEVQSPLSSGVTTLRRVTPLASALTFTV